MSGIQDILYKSHFNQSDIVALLSTTDPDEIELLKQHAYRVKKENVGTKVYLRGLVEFSNTCAKNCYYCGIRRENDKVRRYTVTDNEVLDAFDFAWKSDFASVVLQSGERSDPRFTQRVERLLKKIKKRTNNELGITLSCGEQSLETYKKWYDAGAHRYLLRIEESNQELYKKIHPTDEFHCYDDRIEALGNLRKAGFQVGTGFMIGLPFQTLEDIANDLLFIQEYDIDMVGMGPYIEHESTPLWKHRDTLLSKEERYILAIKCISVLRIMMKDINIASTTALETLHPDGREHGLMAGANIAMPNLTPKQYHEEYLLYQGKPGLFKEKEEAKETIERKVAHIGETIGYGEWGDSKHFENRQLKQP
ncbi:MAG: [FeFe] hydrogenase H-cluster radical SAM maturase HydE [Fibrobacterales bacterium]